MGRKTDPTVGVLYFFVIGTIIFPEALVLPSFTGPSGSALSPGPSVASAQANPPPFGEGNWMITTPTLLKNQDVKVNGSIDMLPTGSVTLDNSSLLFQTDDFMTHRFIIKDGSSLTLKNDSFTGAFDAPFLLIIFPKTVFRMTDSMIVGTLAIFIGSHDTIIENGTFGSMFFGPFVVAGAKVSIIRNKVVSINIFSRPNNSRSA